MDNKAEQLGMPFGTATHRLRKNIMFSLIKRCNLDMCFQCNTKIESSDELSIEHKVPWLHSANPTDLFFDLDNISFSHLSCNSGAARKEYTILGSKAGGLTKHKQSVGRRLRESDGFILCTKCNEFKEPKSFTTTSRVHDFKYNLMCNACRKIHRKKY